MSYWYQLINPDQVLSPTLLVYPHRIRQNIKEMVRVAGGPGRLRPHVKTHKCREIVVMQQEQGIQKFKCATIAEAEMLAQCKARDILLAYQPVGPNARRYLELIGKYPETLFSALVDNLKMVRQLEELASAAVLNLGLFIDLDAGMHRTGILPGPEVSQLLEAIKNSNHLKFRGWHIYDGHIRSSDFEQRKKAVESSFNSLSAFVNFADSFEVVAGGSPTFPVHALNPRFNLSPGTCLLWDQGYSQILPDQRFLPAAVLLTRVISKPGKGLLCLDLGHKAVASEMPHPRVHFPELTEIEFLTHSEEHLVVQTPHAVDLKIGDVLYGIPMHICPTTALHQELAVVKDGRVVDRWKVYARDRRIGV